MIMQDLKRSKEDRLCMLVANHGLNNFKDTNAFICFPFK
jgi:hypothetical protein